MHGLPSIDNMRSLEIDGSKPKKLLANSGKKRSNFFIDAATENLLLKDKYGSRSNRFKLFPVGQTFNSS